jgi:hypothetical protein
VTAESLPRRDVARPVLRLAFTVAWIVGALLAMAIVVTLANAAAAASPAAAEPGACTRLDDDRLRLACFDALFPRGGPQGTAPAAPEAAFGVNDAVRRARGEQPGTDAMPAKIESTVTRLDPLAPGRTRITLANGQVWEQVEPSARFQPRPGDTVTVRQASLGSYLMRARRGAAVRARRLR